MAGSVDVIWSRTVIAGDEMHEDFTAHHGDRRIGRVYRHHSGQWLWAMNTFGPDIVRRYQTTGTVDGKQEAADLVKRVYEACLREIAP